MNKGQAKRTILLSPNLLVWRVALFMIVFSFVFSPLAPVFAQSDDSGSAESSDTSVPDVVTPDSEPLVTPPEQPEEVPPVDSTPAPAPEQAQEQGLDPPAKPEEKIEQLEQPLLTPAKFIKDNSLSQEEQLAKVREHLLRNNLPQDALLRLDAFEAEQAAGPKEDGVFKKAFNFITGNTDAAIENREAIEFAKKEPFKVETFEGEINSAPAEDYEDDFKDAKEQGSIIQKVKNFINDGTFINSNFDGTKKEEGIISFLFGPNRAIAEVSDDPDDYLDAGGEVTFSQAIQDQADALDNDPLKMLNFVRNEVKYIPYYGSKKGSGATLVELAGNDMDKASLLIAMLRHSNIPARYRHVDAKMDIKTVNELLGVDNSDAAAMILSLEKIPYIRYVDQDENPLFFVIEHTYVEAYMPYGVSRGTDINDGGTPQWVPMDPTINAYYYEQLVDLVDLMNDNGFQIETFFENYLEGSYPNLEPLPAFKSEVESYLENYVSPHPPEYDFDLTYDEALTHSYPMIRNLEFIPGTLPYEISANLNTYDYIPTSLRHTIKFIIKDSSNNEVLNHTSYVSDLADKELLVAYDAATPSDQATIDTFDTIYDVVPLSLVNVKPVVKVNGSVLATGTASSTMGKVQKYTMEFNTPKRTVGSPVATEVIDSIEKSTITGTAEAIALNTDRAIPPELRPEEDTESDSFMSNQMLYRTALDYLDRLQYTQGELADIIGGDFTHVATRASISNGVQVTTSGGQPYSFDWKGLRIDASSKVRYFNRFDEDIKKNRKEFIAIFGLQASQDESDIFEDNFDVESVATVKGLKMVSDGQFAGVTMHKITEANENDIDSLNISNSTKTIFHTAIDNDRIIYTPSAPITYGAWSGLFYITVDFEGGDATYAIGEGLNGGYTIEQWPSGWDNFWRSHLLPGLTATITSPDNGDSFIKGKEDIHFSAHYTSSLHSWVENIFVSTKNKPIGPFQLKSGYGTTATKLVNITNGTTATSIECVSSLENGAVVLPATTGAIGEEMHLPLSIDTNSGVYQARYNNYVQYKKQDDIYSHPTAAQFFQELKGANMTTLNVNNPWIDPLTGKYWNMSVWYGAFSKPAVNIDHEKYYMNMRWDYNGHGKKFFGKKVWIKNPETGKAVLAGILEYGPSITTNRVAGASPEAMQAISVVTNDVMEYCLASDQNIPYGTVVNY